MNQEQTNQALNLTVKELSNKLAEELATKNLLAVQLTEANQKNETLQARVNELEALLDEKTEPAEGE